MPNSGTRRRRRSRGVAVEPRRRRAGRARGPARRRRAAGRRAPAPAARLVLGRRSSVPVALEGDLADRRGDRLVAVEHAHLDLAAAGLRAGEWSRGGRPAPRGSPTPPAPGEVPRSIPAGRACRTPGSRGGGRSGRAQRPVRAPTAPPVARPRAGCRDALGGRVEDLEESLVVAMPSARPGADIGDARRLEAPCTVPSPWGPCSPGRGCGPAGEGVQAGPPRRRRAPSASPRRSTRPRRRSGPA